MLDWTNTDRATMTITGVDHTKDQHVAFNAIMLLTAVYINISVCVFACVCASVRACVRACM